MKHMKSKLLGLLSLLALVPARALADIQTVTPPSGIVGPDIYALISRVTNILALVAGSAAVIAIVIGGILYITSAGDEKRVSAAKNTLLYAVIGIIVAMLAFAIANFVISGLQTGTPK